ncbi:putative quinol monooxygenase [uncultured Sphingomonas sp.]|uniref:putative quinol monooxygenase n=1 Tax=uncultured Sphingomonas sp. TaxID=158754 RepID=UPI0035CA2981
MILVTGHIKLGAGEGEKARALLVKHMADCNAEEGCEFYSFAYDVTDPDLVRISESWASPEAIAAHGELPHQKAFGRALQAHGVQDVRVEGWNAEHWRTLIGG